MHTYEKHYTDSSGKYEIIQVRTDGTRRKIEENHVGFLTWLEENELPEVAYVAPPTPDPIEVAKAQLMATDVGMARVTEDVYNYIVNGVPIPQAAIDKIAERVALRAQLTSQ